MGHGRREQRPRAPRRGTLRRARRRFHQFRLSISAPLSTRGPWTPTSTLWPVCKFPAATPHSRLRHLCCADNSIRCLYVLMSDGRVCSTDEEPAPPDVGLHPPQDEGQGRQQRDSGCVMHHLASCIPLYVQIAPSHMPEFLFRTQTGSGSQSSPGFRTARAAYPSNTPQPLHRRCTQDRVLSPEKQKQKPK